MPRHVFPAGGGRAHGRPNQDSVGLACSANVLKLLCRIIVERVFPGGTYFFTVVTYARWPFLTDPRCQAILADVIREVQLSHPFSVDAWVYLPEHWHCLWTLSVGDTDYSKR